MKYLFLCLFLIPVVCFSQEKRDSKIIVTASDTAGVFGKVVRGLYSAGYIVDVQDEKNGFISTKEKSLPKDASTSVIFKILIEGPVINISGETASNVTISIGGAKSEKTFVPIGFYGMKGSSMKNAWNEMDKIAKQLGSVSYSR